MEGHELALDEQLRAVYGEDYIDVTEDVKCYEYGKTFKCQCGHGIGVVHEQQAVRCESCGKYCVDKQWNERGPPEREEDQSSLSDW